MARRPLDRSDRVPGPGDRLRRIAEAARRGIAPAPEDAPAAAELAAWRLRAIVHELAGLIDGSLRYVRLAERGIAGVAAESAEAQAVRRHLETADRALVQTAELVRTGLIPGLASRPSVTASAAGAAFGAWPRPLHESISHAVDVLRPLAEECAVDLDVHLDDSLRAAPAAPIYPVIANVLRNAIEATAETGRAGAVRLRAECLAESGAPASIRITIEDDGPGLRADPERLFTYGYSTKPDGQGIGLPLSRDILRQLGGDITLAARDPSRPSGGIRATITIPMQREHIRGDAA